MASVYWQILQAAQASVQTVSGAVNVVVRRRVVMVEGDATPLYVVTPGKAGEQITNETFERGVLYAYPIVVALIYAANETLTSGLQAYMDQREAVRNQLYRMPPLASFGSPFDLEMDPEEVVEAAAYLGTNYAVTGFGMKYETSEKRLS